MKKLLILSALIMVITQFKAMEPPTFASCMCDKVFVPKVQAMVDKFKVKLPEKLRDNAFIPLIVQIVAGVACKQGAEKAIAVANGDVKLLCTKMADFSKDTFSTITDAVQPFIDLLDSVGLGVLTNPLKLFKELLPQTVSGLCLENIVTTATVCKDVMPANLKATGPVVFATVAARCTVQKLFPPAEKATNRTAAMFNSFLRYALQPAVFKSYAYFAAKSSAETVTDLANSLGKNVTDAKASGSIYSFIAGQSKMALGIFNIMYSTALSGAVTACLADPKVTPVMGLLLQSPAPVAPEDIPLPPDDE